ncbi:MAG TPA: SGNH/GDSL hydrolase family protein [Ramlibacter sp.]|uniref:SGNH/GDSL hydrolase family protein n=1 Tax=Ramlibacter sp. TaxID=1917967 RepID=UPI002B6A4E25|nr:SGNH/GDSL hydrolase family protein [Ramlibacter sp.]HVZ46424.1 SGNH/GDSL hydrolase family protein [Ramlibacter sp.]
MTARLLAAKLALGPVLLPQARWVRRNALRLPEAAGAREGIVGTGQPALRILVVGDSSAAGVGLADQAQALALPLAHKLHETLQHGVGWQLVARSGVDCAAARAMVADAKLERADVVVTVLGVNDVTAQRSASAYVKEVAGLWSDLQARTGARWAVVCGLPPMGLLTVVPQPLRWYLGRYADWLDGALRQWAQAQSLGFCDLRWAADPALLASDGFHPGPSLYPAWAARLAASIAQARADSFHR